MFGKNKTKKEEVKPIAKPLPTLENEVGMDEAQYEQYLILEKERIDKEIASLEEKKKRITVSTDVEQRLTSAEEAIEELQKYVRVLFNDRK